MPTTSRGWHTMLTKVLTVLLAATAVSTAALGKAPECSRDSFSKVVDEAAGALRKHSSETQPRILAGIRQLKVRHGWRDEDEADRARELLSDAETETLDQKAAQLLATMDRLSEEGGQGPGDCAKLSELRATATALQSTVRAKSELVLKRINAALTMRSAEPLPGQPAPAASKPPSLSQLQRAPATVARVDAAMPSEVARAPAPSIELPAPVAPPPQPPSASIAVPSAPAALNGPIVGEWRVTTTTQALPPPLPAPPRAAPTAPPSTVASIQPVSPVAPPQPAKSAPVGESYSVDEIRSAARGLFGTISTSLGSVIEHAFSKYGRPTAYVIGEEGGGAFIAGVRYGSGRVYLKNQKGGKIYWHGPSVGYDFGASGSRTLFLIYRLDSIKELYSGFSGIDGSAYFIGGAGITFLSNNKVIMAPIRTGVGFRLGANVGYLRFTPKATWNPF